MMLFKRPMTAKAAQARPERGTGRRSSATTAHSTSAAQAVRWNTIVITGTSSSAIAMATNDPPHNSPSSNNSAQARGDMVF